MLQNMLEGVLLWNLKNLNRTKMVLGVSGPATLELLKSLGRVNKFIVVETAKC